MSFARDSASLFYVVRGPEPLASPNGMLFRIPALGGAPRRLGTPFDHYPVVSPDGSTLASLRANYPTPDESALVTVRADGSDLRTVMAVREPDVLAPGFFIAPAWSPSGDRIAAVVRDADKRRARLAIVDVATGVARSPRTSFAAAAFTSWMPDGSGIVFTGAAQPKPSSEMGSDLWFQPLPDGAPRPITTGIVEYRSVSLSADGSSLVSVGGLQNAGVWRLPLSGAGRLEKIPSEKQDGLAGLAWLGADRIVFASFDGGTPQIWTMAPDGSDRRQITTEGANFSPRPTRDGRTIYFLSMREGRSGIWRMARDGTAARRIAPAPELWDLVLSPDERQLLFSAPGPDRLDSTWTVSTGGGEPSLLVGGLTQAAVSPDGQAVAGFWQARQDAQPVLAVFPIAGGPPSSVFAAVASMHGGVWWTRDGRALHYTSTDRVNIWRQPLAGGAPTTVTDLGDGMISRGDLSPDGRTLLAVRVYPVRDAFLITGFR
jgi:Tol biopolymer transport system component